MQRLSIICFVALAFAAPANAFEVDAFKSGMSKEQVKEALKSYTFDKVQDFSAQTLIAYDQPEKGSNRQFVFDFCNNKLVGMQQEMAPSNRNLVIIINNYNAKYGQPIKVSAGSNVTSTGDKNELALYWRKGLDVVGVKYNVIAPIEQLLVQYDAPNNCWQTPR
jgi:hypothetical protein